MLKREPKYNGEGSIFSSLLAILFIGLKLTGYINWSWWWVLSPFWIPLALIFGIGAIIFVVAFIGIILKAMLKK